MNIAALPDRIANKIQPNVATGCWEWTAALSPSGYGTAKVDYRKWRAHRLVYTILVGDIAPGMFIHHVCYNRRCVNPAHLRQVTPRDNVLDDRCGSWSAVNARKTHCVHGHEFTPENTAPRPHGGRTCRTCDRLRLTRRRRAA